MFSRLAALLARAFREGILGPSRQARRYRFSPSAEYLESRQVLSAIALTDQEQLLLELVNRARLDPADEVARHAELSDLNSGLSGGTISATPKQPLAPHQALVDAAIAHALDMLENDYFAHDNLSGQTPTNRAAAAGYPSAVSENIAWGGSTGPIDQNDHVYQRHASLFASPGHRRNMLDEDHREIGVGVRYGEFTTTPPVTSTTINWNASMVAEEFGARDGSHFITGVAYADTVVDDDFYTIGESSPNVRITASNASTGKTYFTTTGPSGGYSLQIPNGTYAVTANGGSLPGPLVAAEIVVNSENVKVDFDTSQANSVRTELVGRASDGTWWMAESTAGTFDTSFWGKWSTSVTWEDVQTLDFNGDGLTDIAGRANGQWWVAQSTGSFFVTKYAGSWSTATGWSDVQAGDFDGDGLDDIVGRADDGTLWVASSDGNTFANQYWGRWSSIDWNDVNVGDVNGDGRDDIVGRAADGTWWAGRSNGQRFVNEFWGRWSATATWTDVRLADANGDGKADVVGRTEEYGRWWVGVSTGSKFASKYWGQWTTALSWEDVQIADVNGDGADDIVGRAQGAWWVAVADGSRFLIEYWGSWSTSANWEDVAVADIDGDGDDDLVGRANGQWWVADSTGSRFANRYLGTTWSTSVIWQDVASRDFV